MKFKVFLLLNIFILNSGICQDIKIINLDSEDKIYSIARSSRILEDKTNSLTINDITSPIVYSKFEECKLDYPNLGITSSTY